MNNPEEIFTEIAYVRFVWKVILLVSFLFVASCDRCAPKNITDFTVHVIKTIKE